MTAVAVQVESLSKTYKVYASPWDRLREVLTRRSRHRDFHALSDVTFSVERGKGFGIVGENGAGKSTLLKILAGIAMPSAGRIAVAGKVASILELGSGFHPEFTGRQNIVLNAAMLGLGEEELHAKLPAIVAWSELGDFIDQPVKCYSTGMNMRLGFSIATQVEPEILIIDEALSVGDGYFQKKCMDRLLELVEQGTTLLFCSHAMYYVSAFCERALWLRNGRLTALGPATEVIREYENFLMAKSVAAPRAAPAEEPSAEAAAEPAAGLEGPARLTGVRLERDEDQPATYRQGDDWALEIEWESRDPALGFHLAVGVNRIDEVEVLAFATHLDGLSPLSGGRRYSARLAVPSLPMRSGRFTLYVFLLDEAGLHIFDRQVLPGAFEVVSPTYRPGLIDAPHDWGWHPVARAREARLAGEAR